MVLYQQEELIYSTNLESKHLFVYYLLILKDLPKIFCLFELEKLGDMDSLNINNNIFQIEILNFKF